MVNNVLLGNSRLPKRLAYIVSHSRPYSSNGYAIRTHEVALALTYHGNEVIVINRPGRPWDIEGFSSNSHVSPDQIIDGVRYIFLRVSPASSLHYTINSSSAEDVLFDAFRVFRPSVVMAASNWRNAEPALGAARRYGAPFIYEQRGFWEMNKMGSAELSNSNMLDEREREVSLSNRSDAVVTLSDTMKDEMSKRGVHSKIILLKNGVWRRGNNKVDAEVTKNDRGNYKIGYIGSYSEYEGIDIIIRLVGRLRRDGLEVSALLVGSAAPKGLIETNVGNTVPAHLIGLARELGVAEYVNFVSRVGPADVASYFASLDAFVLPRRRTEMTSIVPPLKPYTAASYGVPVFMTDMPPLDEIAKEIGATLFPEADLAALSTAVADVLEQRRRGRATPALSGLTWEERAETLAKFIRNVSSQQY